MDHWNHSVVKTTTSTGEVFYQIHEAYYNKAGNLCAITENPIAACGESVEELREELQRMLKCCDKPTLDGDNLEFDSPKPDKPEPNRNLSFRTQ